MSQKQTLKQLQQKLRSVYWKLHSTVEEWEKQLLTIELHYLMSSITFLQSELNKKP
jgi:hypothetical protein